MDRKVVVIGSLNYDVVLKQKHLPIEGETCFADTVYYCSGGKGANQAVQAAKLGLPTYMVGCVGNDMMGEFLKETLDSYGVHTEYLKKHFGNSGMSVAQSLYDGSVRASVVKGANDLVTVQDIEALGEFLNPEDIVVLQLEVPISVVEFSISFCKKKGCCIILNGAPATCVNRKILSLVDVFVVNEIEAEFYCGNSIQTKEEAEIEIHKLVQELNNICIFTLGKVGAVVCKNEECRFIPSKKVKAIESTGAGDSFIGGLCYGLLSDMDIFEAAEFATCCSAKTVCKIGGQPAMPTLAEVTN